MAAFFLCLISTIPGGLNIDPSLHWYTLETDHFAVHFSCRGRIDEDSKNLAYHVAELAEDIHNKLTGIIGWTPRNPTQIVIADFFDYSNGWAAPIPNNTIIIIPTLPLGSRTNYDDWLRTLIAHEYAHIIQMDMTRGIPAALRKVFGRVILTNPLMPVWMLEGYALQYETRLTSFGRLRSSEYDMMVRAAARSGKLLTVDRCGNYELQRYPGGRAPYLYGGLFYRSMAKRTRPDIWDQYSLRHAGVPLLYDYNARRTFGKGFHYLWHQWQNETMTHAESTETILQQKPLTRFKRITREGFLTGSPFWSRTGAEIYYISRNGKEYPCIKATDSTGQNTRVIHRGRILGNMTISPDGRWLGFAEMNIQHNYYDYSDIFALDLHKGTVRRLTHGLRGRDPDFDPDTNSVVFVANNKGRNDLMLLNLATGEIQNLTETEDYTAYHSPRFSPDGRYIAVGIHRPGGYADIELLDMNTGWRIPVTEDRANDLSPCWSRTGKYLFFVSDRTGVFNLYAYSIQTGQTYRCSNVLYGVFEPAVSPDNRTIAMVSYTADGNDIQVTPFNARTWEPAEPFHDTFPVIEPLIPGFNSTIYYYNPFPTVLPKLWFPFVSLDDSWNFGACTFGWDVLQFHTYMAAAGYRLTGTPFLGIDYQLSRYRPLLQLTGEFDLNQQDARINIDLPFHATRRLTWLDFSALGRHDAIFTSSYSLDFTTSNAFCYRFDAAPVQGGIAGVHTDLESKTFQNKRDRTRILAYHTRFLGSPPRTWSLRLCTAAGTAFGDISADSAWKIHSGPGILKVRGFSHESEPTKNIIVAGAQFRTPLCWPERGPDLIPVFLRNINLALFFDWGMNWNDWVPTDKNWKNSRVGLGAEIRTDLILAHMLPVNLSIGYAVGLRPEIDTQFYLNLNSALLSELLNRFSSDRFQPLHSRHLSGPGFRKEYSPIF